MTNKSDQPWIYLGLVLLIILVPFSVIVYNRNVNFTQMQPYDEIVAIQTKKEEDEPLADDFYIKYVGRKRLEKKLRDPGSMEIIAERLVKPGKLGNRVGYECQFRARNGFGGYNVETFYTE